MDIFRLLLFFHHALVCDVPILEALWLTSDRMDAELSQIFLRLHHQLREWEFTFDLKALSWRYRDKISCSMSRGVRLDWGQFSVWNVPHDGVSVIQRNRCFSFQLSYPRNTYQLWDETTHKLNVSLWRDDWFIELLRFVRPLPECIVEKRPFFEFKKKPLNTI